jgi:hypothetical protein
LYYKSHLPTRTAITELGTRKEGRRRKGGRRKREDRKDGSGKRGRRKREERKTGRTEGDTYMNMTA